MQRLPLLAVGDVLVVLVAVVTAAYHLVLHWLWPETRDRFWAGIIALGTAVYALGAAGLYITADPGMAPLYQRLMLVAGAMICHSVPPYLAALEGRTLGREAKILWASLVAWVVLILGTPWVFADTVHPLSLSWHDAPYLQPDSGPLNEFCYIALLIIAARPILRAALAWKSRGIRVRMIVLTTTFWILLAAYDGLVGLRWIAAGPAFVLEYGLLFLALFLFGDSVTEHARLLRQAVSGRSAAEEAFDLLARGSPDAIFLLRGEAIAFANEAAARMVGVSSSKELLERPLAHLVHSDDLEVLLRKPEADASAPGPRQTVRFRRDDLSLATAVMALAPVVVDGAPAVLAIARDVSEEEALRAKVMTLDRQIAVGTLAAGIATQIDEPLAQVGQQLEQLVEHAPQLVGEATDRLAQVRGIVADLQASTRISDTDRFEKQHLSEVLAVSLRMTRPLLEARARVETDLRLMPPVLAAPGRLSQVFINLLKNAADALPEGLAEQHRIRLHGFEDEGEAVVTIEDDGLGMEAHEIQRIFDPFYTTKAVGEGTGLGLFICHRIVTGCGGQIAVRSEPGEGTRFTVRLPSAPF